MMHTFICPKAGDCPYYSCSHKEEHDESDECTNTDTCPACTRYTGIIPMNIWETLRHNVNLVQGENLGNNTWTVPLIHRARILESYNLCHHPTIDTYLGYLRKAGYLYTVGRGVYQRISDIPHMSLTELRNEAYGERIYGPREGMVIGVDRANPNFQSINTSASRYTWEIKDDTYVPLSLDEKKEVFRKTYHVDSIDEFLSEEDMQIE